ncbi:MAG: DUF2520 domain-containing protein [Desulfitobacteriaceae bacterium]|nr:DUF2520 domain-containing protein [Desulfitobacteriaceae bacterium]MDD4401329.1 DUF2520 domain-containing protein [Desulfitobacteriaceae bacterium]
MKFGIIGTGVVGTALAVRLEKAGYECVGVNTRTEESYKVFRKYLNKGHYSLESLVPKADMLFITTQDGVIQQVAKELTSRGLIIPGQLWIHCSGSLGSQVLRAAEDAPVKCLSIHPLQSFANIPEAINLIKGTHFGIEGEAEEVAERMVRDLGGIPHRLKTANKSSYHAGAVVASNYLVVLASLAVKLFAQAGIGSQEALQSLIPLMKGTLHNLEEIGIPQALTGPIARGDCAVVRGHLQHLLPQQAALYRLLGKEALELGQAKWQQAGLLYPVDALKELEDLLSS